MSKNYNSTLQTNNTDLQAILNTINELPNAGGSVETVEQATPSITVNSSTGLITATTTQTAGYVAAGTKSSTHQLAFQAAQTITPGTTNKTIAANTYLGGVQTIKGDANLVASNIVSGKSIFGVVGTATTGDTSTEDGLLTKTVTTYTNSRITSIGMYAFVGCNNLTSVSFPNVTIIGENAFRGCYGLTSVSFPNVTSIGMYAFNGCSGLTSVSFPNVTSISMYAFVGCNNLTSVSFPNVTSIGMYAFSTCSKLTSVSFPKATNIYGGAFAFCSNLTSIYLLGSSVCALNNSQVFNGTKITSSAGSIFVKSSLLTQYKSATNWVYFSNRIFGV